MQRNSKAFGLQPEHGNWLIIYHQLNHCSDVEIDNTGSGTTNICHVKSFQFVQEKACFENLRITKAGSYDLFIQVRFVKKFCACWEVLLVLSFSLLFVLLISIPYY